ncbi:hypothetical protein AX16_003486 [Volvariella volvacea WC 439]|nr:hypothetical protein AX16_003486 [Volvariella volvacea WC 439]
MRNVSSLVNLPPEISLKTIRELSWKDVLRVRQTCKYLHGISKTKFIWQAIAHRELSCGSHHPPDLCLERPINTYTAEELEHLILRWKSAEIGWRTDDGAPTRERRLNFGFPPDIQVDCLHLIRGGRWLLVGLTSGSIVFYDLDESDPTPRVLIPQPQSIPDAVQIAIDIDTSSPMLTFELESKGQCKIEIWRVSLEYDSHSSTSNLVAHRLKSFQPEPYGRVPTISILGEYLAYSLVHDEADIKHAIVMRWVDLGDTPSNYDKWAKRTQFSVTYFSAMDRMFFFTTIFPSPE